MPNEENCDHIFDYEETHCVKCNKTVAQIDGVDIIEGLEKRIDQMVDDFKLVFDMLLDFLESLNVKIITDIDGKNWSIEDLKTLYRNYWVV